MDTQLSRGACPGFFIETNYQLWHRLGADPASLGNDRVRMGVTLIAAGMRYVWKRLREPMVTALSLDRQESLAALATAMIAIDDEVLPTELAQLETQLAAAGVVLSPHLRRQVEQWLREVDPLELFWAGVQGLVPQDREIALKMIAQLALVDGQTLIEENDLVVILGENLGFSYADICALVQQATQL